AVDPEPAAARVDDVDLEPGIEVPDDVGDLPRDGDDARRTAVCTIRETMTADRIVDPPRDDVRRAAEEPAQVRGVDAPPLVHVHEIDAAKGRGDAERVSRDEPQLDGKPLHALRERLAPARDEHLLDPAREAANQELGLTLAATTAFRDVDVGDSEGQSGFGSRGRRRGPGMIPASRRRRAFACAALNP